MKYLKKINVFELFTVIVIVVTIFTLSIFQSYAATVTYSGSGFSTSSFSLAQGASLTIVNSTNSIIYIEKTYLCSGGAFCGNDPINTVSSGSNERTFGSFSSSDAGKTYQFRIKSNPSQVVSVTIANNPVTTTLPPTTTIKITTPKPTTAIPTPTVKSRTSTPPQQTTSTTTETVASTIESTSAIATSTLSETTTTAPIQSSTTANSTSANSNKNDSTGIIIGSIALLLVLLVAGGLYYANKKGMLSTKKTTEIKKPE